MFARTRKMGRKFQFRDFDCCNIGKLKLYGKPCELNVLKYNGSQSINDISYDRIEILPSNYFEFHVISKNTQQDLQQLLEGVKAGIEFDDFFGGNSKDYPAKNLGIGSRIFVTLLFGRILFATKPLIHIEASEKNRGTKFYLLKVSGLIRNSFLLYSVNCSVMYSSGGKRVSPSFKRVDKQFLIELQELLENHLKKSCKSR